MIREVSGDSIQLHVALSGSLYEPETNQIRERLTHYIDKGQKAISIDFSEVDYIDCHGLGTLVFVRKRALQKGASLKIKGLQGRVKRLFAKTHMHKVFDIA